MRTKTVTETKRKNFLIEAALEGVKEQFDAAPPESQIVSVLHGTHTFTIRYGDGEMYKIKVQKVRRVE